MRAVFPRENEASSHGEMLHKRKLNKLSLNRIWKLFSRERERERERTIMSTIICSRRAMEKVLLLKRKSSRFTSTFASNSSFSSKAQQREDKDEEQRGQRLGGTITTTSTLPSLRSRMKHFAKIVHPDILGQHFPRANAMHESEDKERKYVLENNQNALAELNAVLDSITKEKKFPKTGVKVIAIFKLFGIFIVFCRRFSLSLLLFVFVVSDVRSAICERMFAFARALSVCLVSV